ncbi:shikimate kinase [Mobilisporobacter senegalensis]|uniref:Shikimate kinase n=1 Tax=Mobilisporobacter senegalensis TaxID=1329262 RepID=A0A3N1XPW1_9FIRM|nr:shikimate kinase [Mobilisporobacter senegalensis]ROR27142.1 shikimate kinase [Mobilisporobacter senegalensis]
MADNIILIGFMGSGKTSVGKLLAKSLSFQFIDTDEEIEEKNKMKISKIFDVYGEEYFRDLETNYIKNLIHHIQSSVISTGGGLPVREGNSEILRELGVVVYLKARKETIINRVKEDDTRPLLQTDDLEGRVNSLLTLREPSYRETAHIEIETDDLSISEIISEIMGQYHDMVKKDNL